MSRFRARFRASAACVALLLVAAPVHASPLDNPVQFVRDFESRAAEYGQRTVVEPTSCSPSGCSYEIGREQFYLTVRFDRSLYAVYPASTGGGAAVRVVALVAAVLQDAKATVDVVNRLASALPSSPDGATLEAHGYVFSWSYGNGVASLHIEQHRPAPRKNSP